MNNAFKEIIDAIEIIVGKETQNITNIYSGTVSGINADKTCNIVLSGKEYKVSYVGGVPSVGSIQRVFVPQNNMSQAFIIVPIQGGGSGGGAVDSVNGKTGDVVLTSKDVGALPNTTIIPSKTSELTNDSGYINSIPVASNVQLGGVKIGQGISIDGDGIISTTGETDVVKWSVIQDTPTTISGYGIADAKIVNGTIILGNQSIKPLTAAPVISVDGKIGAVTTESIKYTIQDLTDAQKQQARDNIGAGTSSFDGNYNSLSNQPTIPTKVSQLENDSGYIIDNGIVICNISADNVPDMTTQEINSAVGDGKIVFAKKSALTYFLTVSVPYMSRFDIINGSVDNYVILQNESVVSAGQILLQSTSDKVTTLTNTSTDEQYPSAKCVYTELMNLKSKINSKQEKPEIYTVTASVVDWDQDDNGYWTQTINVDGLSYDENAVIIPRLIISGDNINDDRQSVLDFSLINKFEIVADGYLTLFSVGEAQPQTFLTFQLFVWHSNL